MRRPPSAGRAQPPPSSGVPANPARPRQKGDTHVNRTAPPMSSRAALEPALASASRRPRCLPSGRGGPPARASIRVLACGSRVVADGRLEVRAALRKMTEGSGLLREPEENQNSLGESLPVVLSCGPYSAFTLDVLFTVG
ncbi:uncharacterized protein LOC135322237 [Camelus dromedarius]|uniref:uncharacterized protein LOC135322237 n=1 Tax=Camelus dromedarius TaxID=9838 RepID=UPI003119AE76